jgi:hypothetical protein
MATYRYVAKDIQTSLKKAFDDADIRLTQILYWIQVVANRLRVDQKEKTDTGLFLSTFCPVEVTTDQKGRQYFDLPSAVMDLPNEGGIEYITYNFESGCCCEGATFAQTFFQPTSAGAIHRLYGDEYEKPTPQNPYFYRAGVECGSGVRVYLVGTECINLRDVEIGVFCSLDPSNVCNLDDQIPLPDERIEELMKEVYALGRWVVLMPEERINQGADETSAQVPESPPVPPAPELNEPENQE